MTRTPHEPPLSEVDLAWLEACLGTMTVNVVFDGTVDEKTDWLGRLLADLKRARAELADSLNSQARWITLMGEAKAERGEMRQERDEARGDAEREYGLRLLAEKERDALRARLEKAEAVCEAAQLLDNLCLPPLEYAGQWQRMHVALKAWREQPEAEVE